MDRARGGSAEAKPPHDIIGISRELATFGVAVCIAASLGGTLASCADTASSNGCPGGAGCACEVSTQCSEGMACSAAGHCMPLESDESAGSGSEAPVGSNSSADAGGPPEIVSLEANMGHLSWDASLVAITAQVVDPDGLEDLVGGLARDASDGALLGPFTQLSGGTFEIALAWTAFDDAGKLDDVMPLTLDVEFTDASGNAANAELDLLVCTKDHDVCGDTSCSALDTAQNCGACGATCLGVDAYCEDGMCCVPDPDGYYGPDCSWPGALEGAAPISSGDTDPYVPYHSPAAMKHAPVVIDGWHL